MNFLLTDGLQDLLFFLMSLFDLFVIRLYTSQLEKGPAVKKHSPSMKDLKRYRQGQGQGSAGKGVYLYDDLAKEHVGQVNGGMDQSGQKVKNGNRFGLGMAGQKSSKGLLTLRVQDKNKEGYMDGAKETPGNWKRNASRSKSAKKRARIQKIIETKEYIE